ncbi:aminoglycoside phosphotransferase family protein [Neobacillus sp. MER 74]|uniref:aminoglycoside phosphotransferase family protein n=1 Tax=Neobacillus sp. MER 74 TaxID=2939566 RepID=UPI0020414D5B|nr:aminoglycoside phosphotransferase family protein [Neobacillus sp. MER 74]MCM3117494.1 aminoglycoside phosphotransferase family protein [Neobacillus sp. MER 74]
MEINNRITAILNDNYGIEATSIEQRPGGWSALAFFVEDKCEKYFLKVYDKRKPSIVPWIEAIDRYTPLVKWMYNHTDLRNNLVNPILTKLKNNKCEDEQYVYLLSEYIEGTTVADQQLSQNQVNELAKILGILHNNTSNIPYELKQQQVNESFDIDFCENLSSFIHYDLDHTDDNVLEIVKPYTGTLLDKINKMRYLSNNLKRKPCQFVLSHADAHNWNVMQGKSLMLIDWECLKLAPQEQDLILIITEPYARHFLNEYKKYMKYETPDLDAFEFYFLKRKLEDIWEWIKNLRFEGLVKSEDVTLEFLKSGLDSCTRTESFRSDIQKVFN